SGCGQIGNCSRGFNSRKLFQAESQITDEQALSGGISVSRVIKRQTGGKQMLNTESEGLIVDEGNSTKQKPAAYQEKQCQRDLDGDHHSPQPTLRTAG